MDDVESTALAAPLRLRFFFSAFAALALLLGAIGVYGAVSYAVARRRAEFAVRMALGASPGIVLRGVMVAGITPVAIGVGIGSSCSPGCEPIGQWHCLWCAADGPGELFGCGAGAVARRSGRCVPASVARGSHKSGGGASRRGELRPRWDGEVHKLSFTARTAANSPSVGRRISNDCLQALSAHSIVSSLFDTAAPARDHQSKRRNN